MTDVKSVLNDLIDSNSDLLFYYSPYNFDRNIDRSRIVAVQKEKYQSLVDDKKFAAFTIGDAHYIVFYEHLAWDTAYFGFANYKIHLVLSTAPSRPLEAAVAYFADHYLPGGAYCFMEVPTEHTGMLQALTGNSFKLIETRLTYYHNRLDQHNAERYDVRQAVADDAGNLKRVAREMRNIYDRFHADPVFSIEKADDFLATYIENSISGFADYVTVPGKSVSPDSFLTANYLQAEWPALDYKISKMVLSAVSSSSNKGWYIKLISEMMYHLRDQIGASCAFLNTQSTNRAVFSTWEKLGFKLGCTTHILSVQKD